MLLSWLTEEKAPVSVMTPKGKAEEEEAVLSSF